MHMPLKCTRNYRGVGIGGAGGQLPPLLLLTWGLCPPPLLLHWLILKITPFQLKAHEACIPISTSNDNAPSHSSQF